MVKIYGCDEIKSELEKMFDCEFNSRGEIGKSISDSWKILDNLATMLRGKYDDWALVENIPEQQIYVVITSKGNLASGSKNIDAGGTFSGIFARFVDNKPKDFKGSPVESLIIDTFEHYIVIE